MIQWNNFKSDDDDDDHDDDGESFCDRSTKVLQIFHEGGPYHIETSPLICSGFYMIGTSVMEELNIDENSHLFKYWCATSSKCTWIKPETVEYSSEVIIIASHHEVLPLTTVKCWMWGISQYDRKTID